MAFGQRRSMKLPDDLVREILWKLPSIKSVVRLSCMCKSWRYLILKDPYFGDKLSNNINSGLKKHNDPVMVFYKRLQNKYYHMRTYKRDNHKLGRVNFHYNLGLELVGSCNGIICFREQTGSPRFHVYLYNPITREYRKLPPTRHPNQFHYGFGFDSRSNDYKVISIPDKSKVEIYKLSSNCWSKLNVDSGLVYNPTKLRTWSQYLNGRCYWILSEGSSNKILTFDFRTEKFGIINLPRAVRGQVDGLGVLDNSVAVFFLKTTCHRFLGTFEVWVMSESGNKGVWVMSGNKRYLWNKVFSKMLVLSGHGLSTFHWPGDTSFLEWTPDREILSLVIKEKGNRRNARTRMLMVDYVYHPFVVFKPSLASVRSGSFAPVSR